MIIRGILDNSLNGQLCIRGFAPIKELARISRADYSYQRSPIDRSDRSDFLEKQTYLFFPEIILGYKFRYKLDNSNNNNPIATIQTGIQYKSNIDKTVVKIKSIDYKQSSDISKKNNIKIAEITFDDEELSKLIQDDRHPLSRIDGNHRLRAAEESSNYKVENMSAPFCIILGEELYNTDGNANVSKINEFDKATKVFFHNINTKTIPLTSEENLRVLIDDKRCFPDEELRDILGKEGLLVRKLIDRFNCDELTGIQHIIKDKHRTCYLDIFTHLSGESKNIEKVLESLKHIDRLYASNNKLKANPSFGLLYAFLYYWMQDKEGKFSLFKNWVVNNHLFETQDVSAEDIINIFDKIAAQKIMVFVAMPYFSEGEVASHNDVYKRVVDRIKSEYHINIGLYPIMTYEGETVEIVQDILNKIECCSIFVGNITGNNPNVTYEMGWARALRKPTILVREENAEEPKSDYKMLYHAKYDARNHLSLEEVCRKNVMAILSELYGFVLEK